MTVLETLLSRIGPPDPRLASRAQGHLDQLTKPAGSLGRLPVVLDGFIAGAAALLAVTLKPETRHFLLASHCSVEPGHRLILEHLGLRPYLDLEMRLGERTGAALAFTLIQAALKIYTEMATFKSAGVSTSRGD